MRLISENTSSFTAKLAEWPQIATFTTVPPGRTEPTACASTASTPAHSNATSAPAPPVRSRIAVGHVDLGRVEHLVRARAGRLRLADGGRLDDEDLRRARGLSAAVGDEPDRARRRTPPRCRPA